MATSPVEKRSVGATRSALPPAPYISSQLSPFLPSPPSTILRLNAFSLLGFLLSVARSSHLGGRVEVKIPSLDLYV